jgi:hypothetical protein
MGEGRREKGEGRREKGEGRRGEGEREKDVPLLVWQKG